MYLCHSTFHITILLYTSGSSRDSMKLSESISHDEVLTGFQTLIYAIKLPEATTMHYRYTFSAVYASLKTIVNY